MSLVWQANGRDFELQDEPRRFLEVVRGRNELPTVRGSSQIIPFRRGRLPVDRLSDLRAIEAKGWVAVPYDEFRAEVDPLKEALDPETQGRLIDTLEDGRQRWIDCQVSNALWHHVTAGTESVSVEFEAFDPFWYAANGIASMDSGLLANEGLFLDGGAPITLGATTAVYSDSTAPIERLSVRITGPAASGVGVRIGQVGFTFGQALATDDVLEVDNHARRVTLNGSNARDRLVLRSGNQHGEYLRLQPGNNTVHVTGSPADARLHYMRTYR